MKKSLVCLEYVLKIAAVAVIWLIAAYVDWFAMPFLWLLFYAWAFPPLWAVYAVAAYVLWALPVAPRGEMSFAKKWFVVPLIPLGCIAVAAGVVVLSGVGYEMFQHRMVTREINAFVKRADEQLVYINAVDPERYPKGIYKSVVDVSSVYIDYDTMEVAFVYYDWSFGDQYEVYQLHQTENTDGSFLDFYGNPVTLPFVSENSQFQSFSELREPGAVLFTYYPEGYSERLGVNYISSGDTNAIAIVMADGTLWTAQFEDTDLGLNTNVLGIALCHKDELDDYQ